MNRREIAEQIFIRMAANTPDHRKDILAVKAINASGEFMAKWNETFAEVIRTACDSDDDFSALLERETLRGGRYHE